MRRLDPVSMLPSIPMSDSSVDESAKHRGTSVQRLELPYTATLRGRQVTFRLMGAGDGAAMLAFTTAQPQEDLLFLRHDITQPAVIERWLERIARGRVVTVLALVDEQVVGYCSLHLNDILWTRHLAEILVLVASPYRGSGIGSELARRVLSIARDYDRLHKLVVQMMVSQQTSQNLFHELGFIPEASLHDWVMDRGGRTHDLIVMSREVEELP